MNLVGSILALESTLPPVRDVCEYVVGAGGLYVRAEDSRISALVPVAPAPRPLAGLAQALPFARLRVPRVNAGWLWSIWKSALAAMPDEAMYQLVYDDAARHSFGGWACARPQQSASGAHVTFLDVSEASVDLHSHNSMPAFFSATDDADEQGLRFYMVIGRLGTERPEISSRVGVYGHTMRVPAATVFDGLGPFVDTFGRCRVCGCTELQGCEGGCYWVEEDLCSQCAHADESLQAA